MAETLERGYTLKEVADCMGLKVRTIRQWVHDGKIRAVKPDGAKQWVVGESEVRRLTGENANENR